MSARHRHAPPFSMFSFQDIIMSVMGIVILILLVIVLELVNRQLQSPPVQQALVRSDVREALQEAHEQLARVKRSLNSGAWEELAGLNRGEIDRQSAELERLLPALEADLASAQRRHEELTQRRARAEQELVGRGEEAALKQLEEDLATLQQELTRLRASNQLLFRPSETGGKIPWLVQISATEILVAPLGPQQPPLAFSGAPSSVRRKFMVWASQRNPSGEYFVLIAKPGGAKMLTELTVELRKQRFDIGLDLIGIDQTAIDPERGAPVIYPGD